MKTRRAMCRAWGCAIAFAALSGSASLGASAQERTGDGPVRTVTGPVQPITLTIGKGALIQTTTPFAKISVTDEKVVEVTPQSDRAFIVNPRRGGLTNVLIFDGKNTLIATLDVRVREQGQDAARSGDNSPGDEVRVYGRITNAQGQPAKPAVFQCSRTNCVTVGDVPPQPAGGTEPRATSSGARERPDDGTGR